MRAILCRILMAAVVCAVGPIVAAQQLHLTPESCPASIKSITGCPDEGCGGVSDALLNLAKNRTDSPSTAPEILHVHDIVDLDEPNDWLTGQDRNDISGEEGMELRLMAFLKVVKQETSGETCNCELHKLIDTDLHLVMVEHRNDLESDSVTAEITPRVRRLNHPNWGHTNIDKLQKKFVRLTGWLMLDTGHLHHSHKVSANDHAGLSLNRATNWEVHPVMKIEVCNSTLKNCRKGIGWKDVP
jgi:hypothetical protein